MNISTGNDYNINSVSVLNATTLGSSVVNSSLDTNTGDITLNGKLTVSNAEPRTVQYNSSNATQMGQQWDNSSSGDTWQFITDHVVGGETGTYKINHQGNTSGFWTPFFLNRTGDDIGNATFGSSTETCEIIVNGNCNLTDAVDTYSINETEVRASKVKLEKQTETIEKFAGKENVSSFETVEEFVEATGERKDADAYIGKDGKIFINKQRAAK